MNEPRCVLRKRLAGMTRLKHAWGVLKDGDQGEGYFDCNRRGCKVRKIIDLGSQSLDAIRYEGTNEALQS